MQSFTEKELYSKSPQELTLLLYQACIEKLRFAMVLIEGQDYLQANLVLEQCHAIICRLADGLNYEAGTIADQLAVMYEYLAQRLLDANMRKDADAVTEVLELLNKIMMAWQQAMQNTTQPIQSYQKEIRTYDQCAPQTVGGGFDAKE